MVARVRRKLLAASLFVAVAAAGSGSFRSSSERSPAALETILTGSQGLLRSSRAVYTFAASSLDYKYSLMGLERKAEKYYEVRSHVHQRAANRILKLCESNRGFYVKAGQFISSMQHMPKEYVSTLSVLQDKASPCSFEIVKRVLKEEFGSDAMERFKEFDERPVAAASLAQVHHAILVDGQEVAVKVQYPMLEQQLRIDLATMDVLSREVAWLFPDYQFQWIVPEFEKTLKKELDFNQEARNAERTSGIFAHNKYVKIPGIFWEMTSQHILTMEFMHGFKIDDVDNLRLAGVDLSKVARVLIEVFAQMIFLHGYVHGDPHPGNILVCCKGNASKDNFQLVLLDHGLYRELDESFRLEFCRLWKSLVLLDQNGIQEAGEHLGAGKYFKYLPVIFTGRTLNSTSQLGQGMSVEERNQLRKEVRMLTLGDVSQFMEALPRDLLIVLRTDALLRSIASKLGARSHMRLLINAKYAVSGIINTKTKGHDKQSWSSIMRAYLVSWNVLFRLELLKLQFGLKDLSGTFMSLLDELIRKLKLLRKVFLITL